MRSARILTVAVAAAAVAAFGFGGAALAAPAANAKPQPKPAQLRLVTPPGTQLPGRPVPPGFPVVITVDGSPVKLVGSRPGLPVRLLVPPRPGTLPVTVAATAYRVTAHQLNVRTGPGTRHKAVAALGKNTIVKVSGKSRNGFAEIGKNRWVSTKYLAAAKKR